MTIVVAYKWAANPQDAVVGPDGSIDWSRAKAAISEYDPVAIEVGRQVADQTGADLVGVSVGAVDVGSSIARKAAMSRGLDRALIVADDEVTGWNATQVARAVAALVRSVPGVDLVVTGDASVDENAKVTSALVAGCLGWPCFQEIVQVTQIDAGWQLRQIVPGGTRTLQVTGPVVVAVATDAAAARVPGMKDILAAGKKEVTLVPVADLGVPDTGPSVVGRSRPPARARKNQIFAGADAVASLVAALRADGLVTDTGRM